MEIKEDVCFMPDGTNIEYTMSGTGDKILILHRSNRNDEELEQLIMQKKLIDFFTLI